MSFQDIESSQENWNDGQSFVQENLSKEEVEEDLVNAYKQWIPKRKRTMVKLKELTSKLHEQQLHVSKSTKAGAIAGTIGGILLIASLTTAPSTFGVVLAVILVGAGIGGAGGLKMFVSKVVEVTLAKLGLKEVQGAVDEDEEACTQLQEKLDNLERNLSLEKHVPTKPRVRKLGQLEEDLVNTYKQWIPKRKRTMEKLKKLTSKLHEQHIKVSKSTKAGATAGTIGGILLIAGLITAPFTFAVELAVSLVGAGIGGAVSGGLVMSVSKVVEETLAKLGLKEVQGALDEEEEACTQLQEKLDKLERFISDLREMESNGSELAKRNLLSEEVDAQDITRYRDQLKEDLVDTFKQWIPKRKRTIEKLEELASKLHEQHMDVSKSTIAGASVSIVGGILAIAGLIVTPLTFGAGLVVSLTGAGIGGAGSVVMSVSKVVEIILEKLGLKEVQRAIDDDKEAHSQLQEKLDNLERFIFDLRKMGSNGFAFLHDHAEWRFTTSTEERIDLFARFLRVFSSAASVGAGAFAAAGTFARAGALAGVPMANLAGGVAGAVLLPLDIYMLVRSSLDVHKGSTTQAVDYIKNLLSALECPKEEEIQEMVQIFITMKSKEALNDGDSNKV